MGCHPSSCIYYTVTHRIHGAAIYGNMDPIKINPIYVSIYTSTMDPMGYGLLTGAFYVGNFRE